MCTADDIEEARPLIEGLVAYHRKRLSKMDAYEAVGAAIGRSSSWVRNVLGRQGRVGLKHRTMKRIEAYCARLSERIEASAERNRQLASVLRGDKHVAAAEGDMGVDMVDRRGGLGMDQVDVESPSASSLTGGDER